MEEEHDPQDDAVLSNDMAEPEKVQAAIKVKSVYEGLVEIAKSHGKLYRTNGRMSDALRFDLTAHSVFVGNTFIIGSGKVKMPILETATARIDITGLPWLTVPEKDIDPQELFRDHWLSRPNGSERFMASNFPAKDIDELTDDEMMTGMPRSEARIRLEAWILCASLDGTLESWVTNRPDWVKDSWFWSPRDTGSKDPTLVIKTEWWKRANGVTWKLTNVFGQCRITTENGTPIAVLDEGTDDMTRRAIVMVPQLIRLAKSLSREAFALQARSRCFDIDPLICELNRAIGFVETGHPQ